MQWCHVNRLGQCAVISTALLSVLNSTSRVLPCSVCCSWSFGFIAGVLKLFTLSLQATDESSQCLHQTGDSSEACIYVNVRQTENKNCKLAELITFGYIQSKQSKKQEKNPNMLLLPFIYCFHFLSLKLSMFYLR